MTSSNKLTAGDIVKKVLLYAALILMAFIMLVPFAWMISASLKFEKDVFSFPIVWFPENPQWGNYSEIWQKVPLLTGFFNSVKLTICVTLLQLATSSLAAYAFAKLEFKGRDTIFMLYIMTIAIPWQVYMVPQYKMMTIFGLTDSHLGIILMHAFTATGVFLMRQFFMGIPTELLEAARIDGLSEYGIWAKLMLPLSKPVIATLCLNFRVERLHGPVDLSVNYREENLTGNAENVQHPVFIELRADYGGGYGCPHSGSYPVRIPAEILC